jgi:DNA-binding transcriptional LysR family regulator
MVNLELYRVFNAVAKSGSLTKAAEILYISQPAVSQSIKQLENQLGGRLFARTPKGMELTESGKMMAEYAEKFILLISDAENKFGEMKGRLVNSLKIGASDTLCKNYLLKYIESFHKKYPQVYVQVFNRTTPETVMLLKTGKVDLGFVNLPVSDQALHITDCFDLNDIFVVRPDFLDTDEVIPLKRMQEYPLIMLELSSNTRRSQLEFSQSLGIHLHPEIELGSIDLIIEFAKAGLGIGCVPREFVRRELKSGALKEIETSPALPVRGIGLITLSSVSVNHIVREFIDSINR